MTVNRSVDGESSATRDDDEVSGGEAGSASARPDERLRGTDSETPVSKPPAENTTANAQIGGVELEEEEELAPATGRPREQSSADTERIRNEDDFRGDAEITAVRGAIGKK